MKISGFASDNRAAVHPKVMAALATVNVGHAPSYENDAQTARAKDVLRRHFGAKCEPFFVFNGTAANTLAIRALCDSWQATLCSDVAHLANDEAGAPEALAGCKLILVESHDGVMTLDALKANAGRRGDVQASQPRLISLTQPTEFGTLYEIDKVRAICKWAHARDMVVHVDGTRLVNAAAALGVGLGALTTELGVDVVSLGGTKNGLLYGEAVVFLHPGHCKSFPWLRKQNLQLPSKTRYIAAQFQAWLGGGLWLELARHANAMAARLGAALEGIPEVAIARSVSTNAVFARLPAEWVEPLRKTAPFYVWDEKTGEVRLMCSWDTRPSDVDAFAAAARALSAHPRKKAKIHS